MSFTYDPSLGDNISKARFLIQDTNELAPYFQDETISALLATNGDSPLKVAKALAQALWTQYLQRADVAEVDDVRLDYKDKANQFKILYEELSKQVFTESSSGVVPMYFGGINRAAFNSNRNNQTLVKPAFTKGGEFFDKYNPELYPVDEEKYWPR